MQHLRYLTLAAAGAALLAPTAAAQNVNPTVDGLEADTASRPRLKPDPAPTAAQTARTQLRRLNRTVRRQGRQIRALRRDLASAQGGVTALRNEKNQLVANQAVVDKQQNDAIAATGATVQRGFSDIANALAAVDSNSLARDNDLLNLGNSLADYVFSLCAVDQTQTWFESSLPAC